MKIWQMEPFPLGDRRLPHHIFPPKTLTPDQLQILTGVVCYKVDLEDANALKKRISRVKAERKVVASDIFSIDNNISNLEQKLEQLYEPTTKKEDSMSLVVDGSAYYDVEVKESEWIRINVERGDLIIIPRDRNHRFTLTPQNKVVLQRFYQAKNHTQQG